ncbi:Gfo/Idh/MocA family oxidoreductase [Paraburkholderia sp. C35]|uniref:Gfo/Idh/MocA family protein n=1 Tax=Paraburkholderia sp. C35 TaxID=2126993 RepID=UPI000D69BE08|nr:Gfo/Idh/MocA family oxidoreductase [Paraburkholderia sp. C35]
MTIEQGGQQVPGIAVIGCGRISRSHLAAVATQPELATLVAAVDSDMSLATQAKQRYGAQHALDDVDAALARSDVEAVILCLPNHLHASVAIKAARAGKHVLVEKPMADTADQAHAMADAAREAGVVLAVAQCRRHFRAIRYLADHASDFGKLISAQVSLGVYWPDAQAPWWRDADKASGLVVALNGPHVLDFVQMVMQDDPLRVHAEAVRRNAFWAGEDEAMMLLAYPQGRIASVHLSFNQQPVENRKVLVYERGTAVVDNDTHLTFNGETLVAQGDDERRHYLDEAVEFQRQFREFALAIAGKPNRSVSAAEGIRLMRTLDAVHRAFRSGQSVETGDATQSMEPLDAVP